MTDQPDRLRDAAYRALAALDDLIAASPSPVPAALGARRELAQALQVAQTARPCATHRRGAVG